MKLKHLALAGVGWLVSERGFAVEAAAGTALAARSPCLACHAPDQ